MAFVEIRFLNDKGPEKRSSSFTQSLDENVDLDGITGVELVIGMGRREAVLYHRYDGFSFKNEIAAANEDEADDE